MKKLKLLSLILSLAMLFTAFAGCSGNKAADKNDQPTYTEMPTELKAEKIGSTNVDSIYAGDGGIRYKKNNLYGIMSFDGKNDTGAKYTHCSSTGNYFEVSQVTSASADDVKSLNCMGLTDANGKEIVPQKYASFRKISDRFYQAVEVTEKAKSEDEALIFYQSSGSIVQFAPNEDDPLFKGKWCVYDMYTGKVVEGVTGTNKYSINAKGNFIQYVTDDKKQITVNCNGKKLPENAKLLDNGYYIIEDTKKCCVYNSGDEQLFECSFDGYYPSYGSGNYFLCRQFKDNKTSYAIMDLNGKILSEGYAELPTYCNGNIFKVKDEIYDAEGKKIIDGSYGNAYYDKQFGNAWLLNHKDNNSKYTLIKNDGTVLWTGEQKSGEISIDSNNFIISKKENDTWKNYSYADKSFTIEGNALAPWLSKSTSDKDYAVVDTISGKTIIKGYSEYICGKIPGNAIFVWAQRPTGGFDIYTVK